MKVVFLDIDGVLNSVAFDRERTNGQGNIDKTRLPLLKQILDETGALIVLSSSWRKHWVKDAYLCDHLGEEMNNLYPIHGKRYDDNRKRSSWRIHKITDAAREIEQKICRQILL